jgi:hypothetical protein
MAGPRTSLLQMSARARVTIALLACAVVWAAVAIALA